MTYVLREIVFLAIIAAVFGQPIIASENLHLREVEKKSKYQNRRLLVRYKNDVTTKKRDLAHFSVGAYVVQEFDTPKNLDVVEVAKGISLDDAQEFYREDPNVLYVEPDYEVHAYMQPPPSEPTPPDNPTEPLIDPRFSEQWALNNLGQTGGLADADINAPEMWEHITGDKNIVIAVIDTGINYNHPDLVNNVWTNPGEIAGNNIDDDGNGVVDDIHGFNAISENGDPMDDHGHGSHCAGVVGAQGQNTEGGRGVMQQATIIGCKFLSASGGGSTSGAIACLDYLRNLKTRTENPVNIIATSNSWGGGPSSQALEDAIRAHQEQGILFIAASSNDGQDNDEVDTFPADYQLANVVSVAATDHSDERAWFSNWGKRTVHVAAPGVDILSTVLDDDYEQMSGTSMATPFVAGLAGMIKASNNEYNYRQIKNLLMAGGTPIPALEGKTVSGRRLRAYDKDGFGSLTCENQIVSGRLSPTSNRLLVAVGEKVLLSAININCAQPNGDIVIPVRSLSSANVRLLDNGREMDSSADDGLYTREWVAERTGRYEFVFPGDDKVVVTVYDPENMGTYAKSEEPTFAYRTIAGTALDAQDDWSTTITTPFSLNFAGQSQVFDSLTIGSNGAVSVTNSLSPEMGNQAFPSERFEALIAPFWDDLNPAAGEGDIYYDTLGTAPNREFVVEWRDVRHYNSTDGATFQIVFFEDSSDILFNYLDVDFGNPEVDKGASATVGIQTSKTKFVEVSHDTAALESNKSLRFSVAANTEG